MTFLFVFDASSPLTARFLAVSPSTETPSHACLTRIVATLPSCPPVTLHEHADPEASSVGVLPRWSRIHISTGLLHSMSDEGLRGVLAHESSHIRELHTLATCLYACGIAVSSHLLADDRVFFAALLLFLWLRRYSEYRADEGAAALAGQETMLITLNELARCYPTKTWHHWFSFANVYPTLFIRIRAIETGRRTLP